MSTFHWMSLSPVGALSMTERSKRESLTRCTFRQNALLPDIFSGLALWM